MASALYDTSLSHETVRPGRRQIDSRVGTRVKLSLDAVPGRMADAVTVSFPAGGFRAAPEAVARGEGSLCWIKSSAPVTTAGADGADRIPLQAEGGGNEAGDSGVGSQSR